MRIFTLVSAIAAGSIAFAPIATAGKRCAPQLDHIIVMGVRLGVTLRPNPVLIEINLDSPPAWFSDPRPGSMSNLAGHHDIVGVALDRNLNNPMQSASRYNNFKDAVAQWLDGPDAPEALCGFNGFARHISPSLSIYAPRVIAKDGFGNEIRMAFERSTGAMTIREIVDANGNSFPSSYDKNAFNMDFLKNYDAAVAYARLLENAGGIQVSYSSEKNVGSKAHWQVSCTGDEGARMACLVHSE